MEVAATLSKAPVSPQKARLVADQVRGLPVAKALDILKFSAKKSAGLIKKLLDSAIANAENNEGADIDELRVSTIFVDEAPTFRRYSSRAKGRVNTITKRQSHITIKVSDDGES